MATRIRKDARSVPTWDATIFWYAKAISEMQSRPISDPTSWRYQAAVHDYIRANDPYAGANDKLPSKAEQKRFWRQCQHFSWFFLPWHRMYLGHFEQILLKIIIAKDGPSDWALPYWNYSADDPNARRLPAAFVETNMPDGSPNPLRMAVHGGEILRDDGNDGGLVGDDTDVDLSCLEEQQFEATPQGGPPGFGGPRTGFKHARRAGEPARFGSVEGTPHGSMHNAVGGWMSGFETAALDPIFWLHHCNIDRLWEVWLSQRPQNRGIFANPSDPAWNTAVSFDFHDANGAMVNMTPHQIANTESSTFAYKYDTVPSAQAALPSVAAGGTLRGMGMGIPEMIGATQHITLAGESVTVSIPTSPPTGPASSRAASGIRSRVILNIENITAEGRPKGYAVYVNLPPGADPAQHRDLFAGNLPLFGIDAVERTGEAHPVADGLHYSLDITKVVDVLQSRGQWQPENVRLTFVPKGRTRSPVAVAPVPAVRVGRVSLYLA